MSEDLLLIPQGMLADEERMGYLDTTVFQRNADGPPVARLVTAVNALYSMDRRSPPQVHSALSLIREWEKLKERQAQWRRVLAAVLGIVLSLVYGSIAILEFRQNLFVSALLRSFGAPRGFLYGRHLLENGLLANLAALSAITLLGVLHGTLFGTLGFPRAVLDFGSGNPYFSYEIAAILCWVNLGALLSSIPIAIALRQPVGTILN